MKRCRKRANGDSPLVSARTRPSRLSVCSRKLSCLGCHAYEGDGGRVAPELTGAGGRLRPEYLHGAIYDPQKVMPHAVLPKIKRADAKSIEPRLLAHSKNRVKTAHIWADHAYTCILNRPHGAKLYAVFSMCLVTGTPGWFQRSVFAYKTSPFGRWAKNE